MWWGFVFLARMTFLWFIYLLVLWVYISHTLSDIRMVPRCTFSFGRLFPWPIMPTRQIVGYHSNDQSLCGWNHFYDGLELFPLFSSFSTLLYINKIFNLNINYTISVAETKSTDIFSPPFASAYENCCSAAYLTPKGWCWYIYSVGDVGAEGGGSPRRALWTPIPAQKGAQRSTHTNGRGTRACPSENFTPKTAHTTSSVTAEGEIFTTLHKSRRKFKDRNDTCLILYPQLSRTLGPDFLFLLCYVQVFYTLLLRFYPTNILLHSHLHSFPFSFLIYAIL